LPPSFEIARELHIPGLAIKTICFKSILILIGPSHAVFDVVVDDEIQFLPYKEQ
jgi:hypothetical protein